MANAVLYGFDDLKSIYSSKVTSNIIPVINTAIDRSLEYHNTNFGRLFNLLVQRTTEYKLKYNTPGSERLQPLDEYGRALPTVGGASYDIAFPLQAAGAAWGINRTALAKMTVEQVNNRMAQKLEADIAWQRDHILGALFANAPWTFTDKEHGALTVMPLANGDTQTYFNRNGANATDDHLYKQAAGIADATNPFPTIYDELLEHPENDGDVIAFIPSNLRATTEALATFHDFGDPDITRGVGNDRLTGELGVEVPGTVIGKADKVWIVEWASLPSSYGFAITTDGEKAVAMREDPESELRGFRLVGTRTDVPFTEDQYERRAGYGIWSRTGALVFRIGDASYAVPTGYDVPMP